MRRYWKTLKGLHYTVTKVVRREKAAGTPAPTTSTLQQEAYRKQFYRT